MKREIRKAVIFEIGGSHDECILSQVMALREQGCDVIFCGSRDLYMRNVQFAQWFTGFHEVKLPKTMFGDFNAMRQLNSWLKANEVDLLIANTGQGGHVRNLCLTSNKRTRFVGIIHTIKMLQGSFTQWLISRKIKTYFVLNDTLKERVPTKNGIHVASFYPLDYPHFEGVQLPEKKGYWFTIIGGVEFRRKDLSGFLRFAQSCPEEIQFVFLGKTDTKREDVGQFVKECEIRGLKNRVHFFDQYVDQPTFDAYLRKTDAILPLVHPGTPSAEEYFTRQISGAINVAFSYHIPMMIHEQYRNWEDFSSGCVFYAMDTMADRAQELVDRREDLKKQLEENPKFSKERQRRRFVEELEEASSQYLIGGDSI